MTKNVVNFNVTTLCKCNNQQRVYRRCDCRSEKMIQVWKILAGIWLRNWQLAIATGKQPLCMKKEYCYFFLIWGAKFCVTNHLNSSFQCKKVKITKKKQFFVKNQPVLTFNLCKPSYKSFWFSQVVLRERSWKQKCYTPVPMLFSVHKIQKIT